MNRSEEYRPEEEYKSAEDLRREIADLKIRLAFQEEFEEEVDEILAECENPDPEMLKIIEEEEAGWLEEIARHASHTRKRPMDIRKVLHSTAGRAVAMVLVGMLISISSALAAIHMVRIGVFELNMQNEPQHTYIYMVQKGEAEVPEGWEGYYYPTFIPEGFEFKYIRNGVVMYVDMNENWITFGEKEYSKGISVDTENAEVSNVQINGMDATVIEKEGTSTVVWAVGKRYFIVRIVGEAETAIRIAASVEMIK